MSDDSANITDDAALAVLNGILADWRKPRFGYQ
jgi:hypothetical protein